MKNKTITVIVVVFVLLVASATVGVSLYTAGQRNDAAAAAPAVSPAAESALPDTGDAQQKLNEMLSDAGKTTDNSAVNVIANANYTEMTPEEWDEAAQGYMDYQSTYTDQNRVPYTDGADYSNPNTPVWGE